jgi:hypothetical protein
MFAEQVGQLTDFTDALRHNWREDNLAQLN